MPYVRNDGVNVYYEVEEGDEPSLVFLHGWTANMNWWKDQRNYFSGRYKMVFIDNRGHGNSEKPLEYEHYRFENFVSDLDLIAEEIGLEKFVLVGHSFGTMISMKYCVEHPEKVLALILIGGGTRIRTFHKLGYPFAKFFASIAYTTSAKYVAKLAVGKNAVEVRKWVWEQAMKYTPPYSAMNTYKTLRTIDLRKVAERIDKPTLVIAGEEDALLPLSRSKELNSLIKNSKLVVVKNAGHCVMLERPDEVNRAMDEFISTLTG
ncbi:MULTISPECIES: alpha/beta fold hydrolase [unclassified Archaeoglobus]|jgi:pimeloyl-ACP methyl ester carboxylesterase|uniref:alpha/beta fold hydrolase n=1 Tax=unclassified Archaeoglobus TaxID=2643606 RepID=UPI0025B9DD25|nr:MULTISPECIES: alpha/beta hydrolase [unclassified Archaeoglobus]